MKILVIAEHDNQQLKPATLNTITAAKKIGAEIDVLIAGHNSQSAAEHAAGIEGVTKVLHADNEAYQHPLAENIASLVSDLAAGYSHILAPATTSGKNFMPRLAALLDVNQVSDIIAVESADTFKRPIYAGNAIATVKSLDAIKVVTVRSTAFDAAPAASAKATIEAIDKGADSALSQFVSAELSQSERPELTAARVVVSGGRALQNAENFKLIEQLADRLGAAIGASRAAVDAGYVPNDYQVGQTGKIVAPDLYIAIGISGAIQHLAGMKDSKVIVAINKDEDAPIFQIATYGLVGDLFDIVPQLIEQLN